MIKNNMNVVTAVNQMRIARKLGRIAPETQSRIMRGIGKGWQAEQIWQAGMAFRKQIERDCRPALDAKHHAEYVYFDVPYISGAQMSKITRKQVKTAKITRPALTGYEYTPAWFKEQAKLELAAEKAAMSPEEKSTKKAERATRKAAKKAQALN
jgi:hypothetical protein